MDLHQAALGQEDCDCKLRAVNELDADTYRLTIRSPILLVDSRFILSPSDSSLSLSLLAEIRCKPCSLFGVFNPGVSAGWTWTTGMGVLLLANEVELSLLMAVAFLGSRLE